MRTGNRIPLLSLVLVWVVGVFTLFVKVDGQPTQSTLPSLNGNSSNANNNNATTIASSLGLSEDELSHLREKLEEVGGPQCVKKFLVDFEKYLICAIHFRYMTRVPKQEDGDDGEDGGFLQQLQQNAPEAQEAATQVISGLQGAFSSLNQYVNKTTGSPTVSSWIYSGFQNIFGQVTGVRPPGAAGGTLPPVTPPPYFEIPPQKPTGSSGYPDNSISSGQRPGGTQGGKLPPGSAGGGYEQHPLNPAQGSGGGYPPVGPRPGGSRPVPGDWPVHSPSSGDQGVVNPGSPNIPPAQAHPLSPSQNPPYYEGRPSPPSSGQRYPLPPPYPQPPPPSYPVQPQYGNYGNQPPSGTYEQQRETISSSTTPMPYYEIENNGLYPQNSIANPTNNQEVRTKPPIPRPPSPTPAPTRRPVVPVRLRPPTTKPPPPKRRGTLPSPLPLYPGVGGVLMEDKPQTSISFSPFQVKFLGTGSGESGQFFPFPVRVIPRPKPKPKPRPNPYPGSHNNNGQSGTNSNSNAIPSSWVQPTTRATPTPTTTPPPPFRMHPTHYNREPFIPFDKVKVPIRTTITTAATTMPTPATTLKSLEEEEEENTTAFHNQLLQVFVDSINKIKQSPSTQEPEVRRTPPPPPPLPLPPRRKQPPSSSPLLEAIKQSGIYGTGVGHPSYPDEDDSEEEDNFRKRVTRPNRPTRPARPRPKPSRNPGTIQEPLTTTTTPPPAPAILPVATTLPSSLPELTTLPTFATFIPDLSQTTPALIPTTLNPVVIITPPSLTSPLHNKRPIIIHNMFYPDLEAALLAEQQGLVKVRERSTRAPSDDLDFYQDQQDKENKEP